MQQRITDFITYVRGGGDQDGEVVEQVEDEEAEVARIT
jgi:hypothetical protein